MKTMSKKLGAIVLALALCLSLCCSALAAETQTYSSTTDKDEYGFSIVINPAYSGETYTAYKIFDVTYNDSKTAYSYTIDSSSDWFSLVQASDLFTLTQVSESTTWVVEIKDDVTGAQIAAALSPVPTDATVAATATPTFDANADGSTGSGSVTLNVTDSGAGYYFVTTSVGSVVSINTTNPTAYISDKNTPPTLDKEVSNESDNGKVEEGNNTDGTADTANVGDKLEYVLTIKNAAHLKSLCVHDQIDKGLDYQTGSVKIYLNNYSTEVAPSNYTVQESGCTDGCAFEITFTDAFLDNLNDTDVIYVTYEDVVTEDAVVVHENDAWLEYGQNGLSVKRYTDTYTYGFQLTKTDENDATLAGATFTLADENGTIEFYFDETTNTYIKHDAIDSEYETETKTTEIKVGQTYVFGLEDGTYTLTETAAPDGYNKLAGPVTITISAGTADAPNDLTQWTVDYTYNGTTYTYTGSMNSDTEGVLTWPNVTIQNSTGEILPSTGGIGTTIFYIIGGVLVAGAVVVLITRRRMSNEG